MPACSICGYVSEGAFKFCPECGARPGGAAPRRGQRKVVTVLFCDVVGSTALGEQLDPERQRAVLAAYFDRMKVIVERHGGTVEKFIGDAVMAVFGVPELHEDDALRAIRAAAEMRDALPALGLEGRIGVMTGEVMTGTDERLATGDAVNIAARLEQAAAPGDVLLGQPTVALVGAVADVEAIEPLRLRGKADPVPAFRLLRVHPAPERSYRGRFVGRADELALLQRAWQRVGAERRCELVTVIGEAGVGKSRLAAEFLVSAGATALRGRCLPYGDGITYSPVVEVVQQAGVVPRDPAAAAAIRSLLGEADASTSGEEIAWAVRKTLEEAAVDGPLAVVFDDIQWGEQPLLELIEHVALLSSDAPILLFCMARPELVERRAAWPVTLRLEPLAAADVDALIPPQVSRQLRDQITRSAGGNPLFVEEMLAMAAETHGEVIVPPTLRALLSTRLDQLEPSERSVLEWGSIEGEVFHRGGVQALAPPQTSVTPSLASLVRKNLIRPDTPQLAGDDGFRFRHLLIRDAAYDAMPKATRAELHARFASWLEQHGASLVEQSEIVGYHFERACRYHAELGTSDDGALAAAARRHLIAGGQRALARQDYGAAVALYVRASALAPAGERDLLLEAELDDALEWAGRSDEALRRAEALAERSAATGDRIGELCGKVRAAMHRTELDSGGSIEQLDAVIARALPEFEAAADDMALYVGYAALGNALCWRERIDAGLAAFERGFAHAGRAGHLPSWAPSVRAGLRFAGTTPVPELLAWLDEHEARVGRDQFFRAYRSWSLAMVGRFDEARAILEVARKEQAERGGGTLLANLTVFESTNVELLAGDLAAATAYAAEGFRMHEELGNDGFRCGAAAVQAEVHYELGRHEEAEVWADRAAAICPGGIIGRELEWRPVKAKLLAYRGEHEAAERLIRETVAMCDRTETLDPQATVYAAFGEVLSMAGRGAEACDAFEEAIARYERKGNVVMAGRTRDRLEAVRAP